MNDTALPTYQELSDRMDAAMKTAMVAAMIGDEDAKQEASVLIRECSEQIKNGEYR